MVLEQNEEGREDQEAEEPRYSLDKADSLTREHGELVVAVIVERLVCAWYADVAKSP